MVVVDDAEPRAVPAPPAGRGAASLPAQRRPRGGAEPGHRPRAGAGGRRRPLHRPRLRLPARLGRRPAGRAGAGHVAASGVTCALGSDPARPVPGLRRGDERPLGAARPHGAHLRPLLQPDGPGRGRWRRSGSTSGSRARPARTSTSATGCAASGRSASSPRRWFATTSATRARCAAWAASCGRSGATAPPTRCSGRSTPSSADARLGGLRRRGLQARSRPAEPAAYRRASLSRVRPRRLVPRFWLA